MNYFKSLFSKQSTPNSKQNTMSDLDALNDELVTLKAYRSDIFIDGLGLFLPDELALSKEGELSVLTVTVPFACYGEAKYINSYLSDSGFTHFEVRFDTNITDTYKFKQIKHIVLIASGKGGVGKSTTSVNLAVALANEGANVGLLDADIYGPSVPLMMGISNKQVESLDGKSMEPFVAHNLKIMSIGCLVSPEDASIWRGPMASQSLVQLINETNWGELDYLIVDMPPGTGDIQLTMTQKVPCSGAVVVTTPQDIALADAKKGIAMFDKVNVPLLGLIENMSHYECEECGHQSHVFGKGGAEKLADRYPVNVLGSLALDNQIRVGADVGQPAASDLSSGYAKSYGKIARALACQIYYTSAQNLTKPQIVITKD